MSSESDKKLNIAMLMPSSYFQSGILSFTETVKKILSEKYNIIPISFNKQVPLFLYPARKRVLEERKKRPVVSPNEIVNWFSISSWKKAFNQFKDKAEIFYLPWWTLLVSLPTLYLLKKAKKNNIKTIVEFHNVFDHNVNKIVKFITKIVLRRIFRKVDVIISHSNEDINKIKQISKTDPSIIFIPHMAYNFLLNKGETNSEIKKKLGISADQKTIIQFGIVRPYKGVEYSIEAMRLLKDRGYDIFFLLLGENWINKHQLMAKVKKYNLSNNFKWIDQYIDDSEIAKYFAIADIAIFPYTAASGSGAAQIAFASKVPVIASNVGGFKDTIKDGYNGLLCEPENANSLAEKIEYLINNEEIRKKLVENAEKTIVHKYEFTQIKELYFEVIKNIIEKEKIHVTQPSIQEKKKLRVCVIQNFPLKSTKALSTYLNNIVYGLSQNEEIELIVISSDSKEQIIEQRFKHVIVKGNPYSIKGNLQFTFSAAKALKKENKIKNIDVVHTLYPMSSLASAVISKITKHAAVIYEIRSPWLYIGETSGYLPKVFRSASKLIAIKTEKMLMKKVKGFIFITDSLYELYKKSLPKRYDYIVLPSGINYELFNQYKNKKVDLKSKLGLKEDTKIIGYIGSLEKQRELQVLTKYFKEALTEIPNLSLVFIGEGTGKSDIDEVIQEGNLSNKVFILKPVEHEEIGLWINSFDICVSHLPDIFIYRPSFPLKMLEYAALNKPILATKMQPHSMFSNIYPKIFLYSDPETFKQQIKNLLNNNYKQTEFDIEQFTWKNLTVQMYHFYKKLLKE